MKILFWLASGTVTFALFIGSTMKFLYSWYAYSQGFKNAGVEAGPAFWAAAFFMLFLASAYCLRYRLNDNLKRVDEEERKRQEREKRTRRAEAKPETE
jgi:hypothetical protein